MGSTMNRFFLLGCATAVLATSAAHAQETTSSIRGTITATGAPVAGAAVTVTHVPSGTRATATTSESGAFVISGLRPGGPYVVAIAAPGYEPYQVTEIETVVAQAFELPVQLTASAAAGAGNEIVVTAARLPGARTVSQGPATVLTAAQIANIATVNRDIRDLSRRDPFARLDDSPSGGRSISFAGQNARYNRFSVDGVPITDNFGLNTGWPAEPPLADPARCDRSVPGEGRAVRRARGQFPGRRDQHHPALGHKRVSRAPASMLIRPTS